MSTQVVVQRTVRADGTLELDEKLPLPAGRVQIIVQPVIQPPHDPFWEMMERLWAGQRARGHMPRSVEEVEAERRALRDESEEEIREAGRAHGESRPTPRGSEDEA
jgi:hypothetical protein